MNGSKPSAPDTLTIDADELAGLVQRLRIRHIEELEERTGVGLDEIMGLKSTAKRSHALAYIVMVGRDPDATWADAGNVTLAQLTSPASEVAGELADPTPGVDASAKPTSG